MMSFKNKIITGFTLYWVYEMYRQRKRLVRPVYKAELKIKRYE